MGVRVPLLAPFVFSRVPRVAVSSRSPKSRQSSCGPRASLTVRDPTDADSEGQLSRPAGALESAGAHNRGSWLPRGPGVRRLYLKPASSSRRTARTRQARSVGIFWHCLGRKSCCRCANARPRPRDHSQYAQRPSPNPIWVPAPKGMGSSSPLPSASAGSLSPSTRLEVMAIGIRACEARQKPAARPD